LRLSFCSSGRVLRVTDFSLVFPPSTNWNLKPEEFRTPKGFILYIAFLLYMLTEISGYRNYFSSWGVNSEIKIDRVEELRGKVLLATQMKVSQFGRMREIVLRV